MLSKFQTARSFPQGSRPPRLPKTICLRVPTFKVEHLYLSFPLFFGPNILPPLLIDFSLNQNPHNSIWYLCGFPWFYQATHALSRSRNQLTFLSRPKSHSPMGLQVLQKSAYPLFPRTEKRFAFLQAQGKGRRGVYGACEGLGAGMERNGKIPFRG
ncbi:hypothetical protein BCR34DRAFT_1951 [Clohesyomyces aquaticus]|uniref:Uncharacterized protein n=1 Tax=Clohesyomyces aquaticus TaxID=1231657 RepID=A0A1Y2AB55_9PLEO|nr:hypothetical protein BCR34DRAFT_1951 [Clohesyomyces aquaticus]